LNHIDDAAEAFPEKGDQMPNLFSPARMGALELKNRLIHSATWEGMATEDGSVTEDLVSRYVNLARGEVGFIIPGHMFVHPGGRAARKQIGISDNRHLEGLTRLVSRVHDKGAVIAAQLAHGGRQCPKALIGRKPLAPSGFGRDPASLNKPRAAAERDIHEIIDAFVAAAKRAQQAGFDALQLHCAHGYLLNEFLSPFFNRRKDKWGGSPRNNFRIVENIIRGIQAEIGRDMPLLVKLNTNDFTPRPGIDPHLAARYAEWLVELNITALEISGGTYYSFHTVRGEVPIDGMARALSWWMRPIAKMVFKKQIEPCRFKSLYNMSAVEAIKPVLDGIPLILVGGVRRLSEMEKVLAEKKADFLSMSRPLIREPFLPRHLRTGKTDEAACISCNKCFAAVYNGLPLRCYVSDETGTDLKL
jgi:2,4-dienoyl-CoA reductase-like NADH-dependent reductase (Old Yellow Enzyme family)